MSKLGETAGWPALTYKPGHAVVPGAANWRLFIVQASVPQMQQACDALRARPTALPPPEVE